MVSMTEAMMMRIPAFLTLALLAGLAATPAVAQSSGAAMASMPGMAGPGKSPTDQAMAAGMAAMNRGMATARMTGDADQDFVAMMIPHHQGAVAMAEVELRYGHDPFLRKLARSIIAAQDQEIAAMQDWQQRHPAP